MFKNKGQSIVEYTVLAMLIIVGTIVMGPYVIRSVGAHFKLWQETVDDSVNDRMKRIPIDVTETCPHSDLKSVECGSPLIQGADLCVNQGLTLNDGVQCAPDQRYYYQSGPNRCFYCNGCKADPTCCDVFTACKRAPCCGKRPLEFPGFKRSDFIKDANGRDTIELHSVDANGAPNMDDVADTSILNNLSCYYGEMLLYNNCDNRKIRCQLNSACNPNCIGNLPVNSYGTTTGHLCTPNPQTRLVQDEKISWFEPCPAPPPPEPPADRGSESMTVYYRSTSAMKLYKSDKDWKEGALLGAPFSGSSNGDEPDGYAQCDKEPEESTTFWEGLAAMFGFGGCRTFTCLFWLGPVYCYHRIPLPSPAAAMAWDHGYWGCTRSDDPRHMSYSASFKSIALNILFGWGGGSIAQSVFNSVDHPNDDWNWNGCWRNGVDRRRDKQCSPSSGMNVYRQLDLTVKTGETAYLLAKVAEDGGQPLITLRPFTGDHFGIFEVFVKTDTGKTYCFKPTTTTYSRDSDHYAPGPKIKDEAGDSCKYMVVHGYMEMSVNKELLKLEIPLEKGDDPVVIRYHCDDCPGKCGPTPPACRAKCDVGYSEIDVPDPDNPGNNIVTCLPCTGLKCNYTIDCKVGGLAGASSNLIGAPCDSADELIGCTDTGTGTGHGTRSISFNGCYATKNSLAATDPSQYGCQLNCRKTPGSVTKCTDTPTTPASLCAPSCSFSYPSGTVQKCGGAYNGCNGSCTAPCPNGQTCNTTTHFCEQQ